MDHEGARLSLQMFLHNWGTELAGFLGSVLSLSFWKQLNWLVGFMAVLAGVACTHFGTDIIVYYIDPPAALKVKVSGMVGLMLGVSGFMLIAAFHAAVKAMGEAVPARMPGVLDWLLQRVGIRKQGE